MNGKPVHEVPAKTVINFKSGFGHKKLCDSLTFSAGSACAYSCSFCYVEDLMTKNQHWRGILEKEPAAKFESVVIRRKGAAERVRFELTDGKRQPKFLDPKDTRTIYASPLVDVAANMELVRETVEICKVILELTNWNIRILSKSNLLPKVAQALQDWWLETFKTDDEYWKRMEGKSGPSNRIIYGVSTGTLDNKLAGAFEAGTPLVSKRIESLHWLQDNGFRTFGMICPSLPQKDYHAFAQEMACAIRADRCEHVWAEVLNARGESFTRTHKAIAGAGYAVTAEMFKQVCENKEDWEHYARETFAGHAEVYNGMTIDGQPKLRFLQYITKDSKPFWQANESRGAIIL